LLLLAQRVTSCEKGRASRNSNLSPAHAVRPWKRSSFLARMIPAYYILGLMLCSWNGWVRAGWADIILLPRGRGPMLDGLSGRQLLGSRAVT
jgi:hypothetical protein